jgi:hypothetical protein
VIVFCIFWGNHSLLSSVSVGHIYLTFVFQAIVLVLLVTIALCLVLPLFFGGCWYTFGTIADCAVGFGHIFFLRLSVYFWHKRSLAVY